MDIDIIDCVNKAGLKAVDVIDIMLYDHDMHALRDRLSHLQGKVFEPHERLIFIHNDTEFVIQDCRITLYNLQLLLAELMIPNYSCAIISQQDIAADLERLRLNLTNDTYSIATIDFECHLLFFPNQTDHMCQLNHDMLEKKYIFLNRTTRPHRHFMINYLQSNDLIDQGLVSYLDHNEVIKTEDHGIDQYPKVNHFITVDPFTRINDRWKPEDDSLSKPCQIQIPFRNFVEGPESSHATTDVDIMQRAFCYLASETTFDYPSSFTTEKSFKSFKAMRPMLMLGAPGTLARLRSKGFNTWSRWWDESYDDEVDPNIRFNAVSKIMRWLCGLSLAECSRMLLEMQDLLEHNAYQHQHVFVKKEIQSLIDQLLKNRHR